MKKFLILILSIITIAGSSCKKDFLNLDKNPNIPPTATNDVLLASSLRNTADIVNGGLNNYYTQYACWMGYASWSTGFQPNSQLESYIFTESDYDVWTPLYLNISNYSALKKQNSGANFIAIANIMIAYDFQALVDNYNNVPYSDAIQGRANLTPKYDKGSDIYDHLMKQLDSSIVLIQGAPKTDPLPVSGDIMFNGNMTSWIKLANTLKLKLAIRQSNLAVKAGALKTAVSATQALGYIDATNSAEVNPGYTNLDASGGQQSPVWLAYGFNQSGGGQNGNQTYQANSYAVNFFYSNFDTIRANTLYLVPDSGRVRGTPFGQTTPPSDAGGNPLAVSKFGSGILKSAAMNSKVLSASESLFLQAEGVASGLISGNASALYNAGITAAFEDILSDPKLSSPLATSQADALALKYYSQGSIAYPSGGTLETQKKAIIVQKWAALDLYGAFEAFNEFRRTGYPDNIPLSITPGANAPNQVTRIFYPFVEKSTNSINLKLEATVDIFKSKIFWAK